MLLFIDIDSYKDVDRLTFLLAEVDTARQFAEGIVQNAPWPLLILDRELRVIKANPAFNTVFQTSPEETERQLIYTLGNGSWNVPELRRLLDDIIPHNSRFQDFAVTHEFPHIGEKTLLLNARRIGRDEQETDTILFGIEDITERRQTEERIAAALREKEVLLREVYHRVKNNLQIVSSLLSLQADTVGNEYVRDLLWESQRRIQAMSLVHQKLYDSGDFSSIDVRIYIQSLLEDLARMYDTEGHIALNVQAEGNITIDIAIPCGLILTELVSNAFKYAFSTAQRGRISVTLQPEAQNRWLLVVQDNGIGLPSEIDIAHTNSVGLTLVHDLVSQLEGDVQVNRSRGTMFTIRFPSNQSAGI
jgi:chemotaxis protein methyltransferase CheR